MAMAYQFLWNDNVLVIEFLNADEQGNAVVEYALRMPRDEAIRFAQTTNLMASTRLKKADKTVIQTPEPLPKNI